MRLRSAVTQRLRAFDKFTVPLLNGCARAVVRACRPYIVGVTGTAGKSTTTALILHVLSQAEARPFIGSVVGSVDNMNDDQGLPLTILMHPAWLSYSPLGRALTLAKMPIRALMMAFGRSYPDILVLEFGTHWHGHLHNMVEIAPPNIAVITNIGPGHLERLKTVEGVYREKSALLKHAHDLVVTGSGHDYISRIMEDAKAPVVIADGVGIEAAKGITRAVCSHLRVPSEIIERALSDFRAPGRRLEVVRTERITLIDDSINANPISMRYALDTLSAQEGRRLAILGRMAELGDDEEHFHREVGDYAHGRADIVISVGEAARAYRGHYWFPDLQSCLAALDDLVAQGDVVLVKASASARFGEVARLLRDSGGALVHSDAEGERLSSSQHQFSQN